MTIEPTYAIILDFEATCDDRKQPRPQEIIEFPSIILSLETLDVVDEFRAFVRPVHHPVLSAFCRGFTSIRQADVDIAAFFKDVFCDHQDWVKRNGLNHENAVIVTCGDWDLGTMLPSQCASAVPSVESIPQLYLQWHNIKRSFCEIQNRAKAPGMAGMLRDLKIPLVGHHHCGIDDCRNITTLCRVLFEKGADINVTARLPASKLPPITLRLRLGSRVEPATVFHRSMNSLIGASGRIFKQRILGFYKKSGAQIKNDKDLLSVTPGEEIILRG